MPNVLEQLLGRNNQGVDTQKILQQLFGTGSLQGGSRQIQQPSQGQPSSGDLLSMEMNAAAGRKRLSKKADSEAEQIELYEGSQGLTNRVAKLEGIIEQQKQTIEKGKEQQQMRFIQNPNPFGLGGPDPEGNFRDIGGAMKILSLLAGVGIPSGVEEAQAAQQMAGQQPMQRGEREKQRLEIASETQKTTEQRAFEFDKLAQQHENDRNLLEYTAELEGVKLDDYKIAATVAKNRFLNLIDLRKKIKLRGLGGEQLGALIGLTGVGMERRAEYESITNQFVFDVGALLGQKGRAFTEKEQKLVREKVLAASLASKDSVFVGKMRGVMKLINDRAGEEILTEEDLMGKAVKKYTTGNIKSITED